MCSAQTLDQALKTLQARHTKESAEARYLAAIVDDSPSALLTIDIDGRVELLNKAARQLFARYPLNRIDDLDALGPELVAAIRLPAGTRKITRLILDGVPQKAIFASAQVARLDQPVSVISILPVQSELGALEVAAQADLVRVLTHEIMNSLTPVTSLARTGAELVASAAKRDAALADAKTATETVARRAEGILRFVESYREFAQAPDIHRRSFKAKPWGEEIMRLALANAAEPQDRRAAGRRTEDHEPQCRPGAARAGPAQPASQLNAGDRRSSTSRSSCCRSRASRAAISGSRCATMARAFPKIAARTSSCPSTPPTRAAAASASASRARLRLPTAGRYAPSMRPKAARTCAW